MNNITTNLPNLPTKTGDLRFETGDLPTKKNFYSKLEIFFIAYSLAYSSEYPPSLASVYMSLSFQLSES